MNCSFHMSNQYNWIFHLPSVKNNYNKILFGSRKREKRFKEILSYTTVHIKYLINLFILSYGSIIQHYNSSINRIDKFDKFYRF